MALRGDALWSCRGAGGSRVLGKGKQLLQPLESFVATRAPVDYAECGYCRWLFGTPLGPLPSGGAVIPVTRKTLRKNCSQTDWSILGRGHRWTELLLSLLLAWLSTRVGKQTENAHTSNWPTIATFPCCLRACASCWPILIILEQQQQRHKAKKLAQNGRNCWWAVSWTGPDSSSNRLHMKRNGSSSSSRSSGYGSNNERPSTLSAAREMFALCARFGLQCLSGCVCVRERYMQIVITLREITAN